ncbi:hypothetical protein A2U01_0031858 [Trifolium medium]|uniref:Uncharacterized protein n=1 Tax=Trifolium medium TaxID=97028 RepID=A0A392PF86_9FABA|nr:hypothetical protein [Trifolium medium]
MKDLSLSIHHFDVDYLWMPFSIAHQQRIASDHQEEMVKERENGMHVEGVAELCDFDMSTDLMDFGVGQDVYVSEHMGRYPADIAEGSWELQPAARAKADGCGYSSFLITALLCPPEKELPAI